MTTKRILYKDIPLKLSLDTDDCKLYISYLTDITDDKVLFYNLEYLFEDINYDEQDDSRYIIEYDNLKDTDEFEDYIYNLFSAADNYPDDIKLYLEVL